MTAQPCQRCGGTQHIINISAKCDDRCSILRDGKETHCGYVPVDLGVGGGDYLEIALCTYCGQVQGNWPK